MFKILGITLYILFAQATRCPGFVPSRLKMYGACIHRCFKECVLCFHLSLRIFEISKCQTITALLDRIMLAQLVQAMNEDGFVHATNEGSRG